MSDTTGTAGTATGGTIIVGVDGSASSTDALRWAARQAELTGAHLKVVAAWSWPVMSGYAAPPPELDLEQDMRHVAQSTLHEALGEQPQLPVEVVVGEGSPAGVLLRHSQGADLLVVGSRGHGAFAGMLLGSVSSHCVSHASCPVVVVRGSVP